MSDVATRALRLLMLAALFFAGWKVAHRRVAEGFAAASSDIAGYTAAIEWDPTNPEYLVRRAALRRELLDPEDSRLALEDLRQAVRLNPHNWIYWGELAGLLETSGEDAAAEEAYRKAVQLSPQSGYTHWNLSNYLLRKGDREGWLTELSEAVAREVEYQEPSAVLLLRMGVSSQELDRVWPTDRASTLRLFQFLVARHLDAPAELTSPERLERLWRRLLDDGPVTAPEADFYLRHLIGRGRMQELRVRWSELMASNGWDDAEFAGKRNYVWDGPFETPPCDRGLCWILNPTEDERVEWVTGSGEDFSRQIRIEFLGQSNPEIRNLVRQTVVVDPGAEYEFSFRARSERIESDRGPYFRIQDPSGAFSASTEQVLGTTPWTARQVRFRVPPGSQVLIVSLHRDRSRRLGGQLSGTLWIDDVQLRRVAE